ncbi:MAG: ribbon-helix-helix protein, CopG family [Rubrivivax sp.]|nr:ribbon-helix-helix protein, CopG family [Rubrivivax sp.]
METKTARLTLLIDPNKKAAFERLCARQDRTASQVVRQLIRDYLAHHGVEYEAGEGAEEEPTSPRGATPGRVRIGNAGPKR